MKDGEHATHKHKRLGEVVLLRSTSELAQVLTFTTREKLWVKLTDLSALAPKREPIGPRKREMKRKM